MKCIFKKCIKKNPAICRAFNDFIKDPGGLKQVFHWAKSKIKKYKF